MAPLLSESRSDSSSLSESRSANASICRKRGAKAIVDAELHLADALTDTDVGRPPAPSHITRCALHTARDPRPAPHWVVVE